MRDVEKIIKAIKENPPDVKLRQLTVSHPAADDNGLWFFEQPKQRVRSPNRVIDGDVPFFNRNTREQHKFAARSIEEAVAMLAQLLHFPL